MLISTQQNHGCNGYLGDAKSSGCHVGSCHSLSRSVFPAPVTLPQPPSTPRRWYESALGRRSGLRSLPRAPTRRPEPSLISQPPGESPIISIIRITVQIFDAPAHMCYHPLMLTTASLPRSRAAACPGPRSGDAPTGPVGAVAYRRILVPIRSIFVASASHSEALPQAESSGMRQNASDIGEFN